MSDTQSRRRQREQATEVVPTAAKTPDTAPVPLSVMFGQGGKITLAGTTYELAPFPLSKHQEAQELLSLWPNLLFIAGLVDAGEGDDILNAERFAEAFNNIYAADEDSRLTVESVYSRMAHLAATLDETTVNAMADLIVLALRRRSPDIKREDILDDLDIPTALQILRAIFAINSGMSNRFVTP